MHDIVITEPNHPQAYAAQKYATFFVIVLGLDSGMTVTVNFDNHFFSGTVEIDDIPSEWSLATKTIGEQFKTLIPHAFFGFGHVGAHLSCA